MIIFPSVELLSTDEENEKQQEIKNDYERQLKEKSQENVNLVLAGIQNKSTFKELKLELTNVGLNHKSAKNDLTKIINRLEL